MTLKKNLKIRLKQDSRDLNSHQTFGSALSFDLPKDKNFDNPNIAEKIQPIGNVQCGIFCADYIISNQFNKNIDFDELWNRVPHSRFGVTPNDLFKCVVDYVVVNGEKLKLYNSFYRADTDPKYDKFDSTRSAQIQTNSPVLIYTNWYDNWAGLGKDAIMPIGDKPVSGHLYIGKGWFDGEKFIIEWWGGYTMKMPREVFNKAVSEYGCGATVFSTLEQDEIRKKTILETIKDVCVNVVLLLKQLLIMKNGDNSIPTLPEPAIIKVMDKSQRFYELCYNFIGKHLTMDTSVPSIYGCAEAVSYALKEFGYPIPARGYASTNELYKWLQANCDEVDTPNVGDIIISVSYTGVQGARGHVGTVGKKAIMSNDSESGLWQPYWSLAGWLKHFKDDLKLTTKYFRLRD